MSKMPDPQNLRPREAELYKSVSKRTTTEEYDTANALDELDACRGIIKEHQYRVTMNREDGEYRYCVECEAWISVEKDPKLIPVCKPDCAIAAQLAGIGGE